MITILDPRLWLTVLLISLLSFGAGHLVASKNAKTKYELKIAKDDKEASTKYDSMVVEKDNTLLAVQTAFNSLSIKYEKDTENAKITIDKLQRSVADGSYRMSLAVRSCKASSTNGNAGTTATSSTKEYAELLPETAHDIINVARDADNEVRRTNECIDKYNTVRSEVKKLNEKLIELSKP